MVAIKPVPAMPLSNMQRKQRNKYLRLVIPGFRYILLPDAAEDDGAARNIDQLFGDLFADTGHLLQIQLNFFQWKMFGQFGYARMRGTGFTAGILQLFGQLLFHA